LILAAGSHLSPKWHIRLVGWDVVITKDAADTITPLNVGGKSVSGSSLALKLRTPLGCAFC